MNHDGKLMEKVFVLEKYIKYVSKGQPYSPEREVDRAEGILISEKMEHMEMAWCALDGNIEY